MINFPNNPALGDAFQQGGTVYTCVLANPVVWNAAPASAAIPEAPLDGLVYGRREAAWKALDKADVGLDKVDNTADIYKPISNPTSAALALKQDSISFGGTTQYWRGDHTWQVIDNSTLGAVAKAGDVMTGNLQVPYLNDLGQLDAATGMGFRWDGGNANYLAMGAGQGTGWNWQYIRDSGNLSWLNWEARSLFGIDGSGTVSIAGVVYGNVNNGGDAFYATGSSGFRTDKGANTAFYAPNGGAVLGTTLDANGRITSNSGDGAAFYAPNGGIRADGGGNAFYAPNGHVYSGYDLNGNNVVGRGAVYANNVLYVNPQNGHQCSPGFFDTGANAFLCEVIYAGPNYGYVNQRIFHQGGQWVGWDVLGDPGQELRWSAQSGAVNAAAFNPWSDRRLKTDLSLIEDARAKVAKLIGYTYTSTTSKDYDGNLIRRAGLIAQDALEVLPEAVRLEMAPMDNVDPALPVPLKSKEQIEEEKRYTMDYNAIIALLVNDNNAMAARIDVLEAKLLEIAP